MERCLPVPVEADWDEVTDGLVILDSDAEITAEGVRLTLRWSDATVVVTWLGDGEPVWKSEAKGGQWIVSYDRTALANGEKLTHNWELELKQ